MPKFELDDGFQPPQVALVYSMRPLGGYCGQTVGADGSGNFLKLFYADSAEPAYEALTAFQVKLKRTGRLMSHTVIDGVNVTTSALK
jgi:hypothetical protein